MRCGAGAGGTWSAACAGASSARRTRAPRGRRRRRSVGHLRGGARGARRRRVAHHPGARGALEAALLGDLGTYLPHLLNRQDKNTMQHSIETRVPFLDPDVVALS